MSRADLEKAHDTACQALLQSVLDDTNAQRWYYVEVFSAEAVLLACRYDLEVERAVVVAVRVVHAVVTAEGDEEGYTKRREETAQTDSLRCIFGNSFRPVAIPPAILAWHDGLVVRLAQAAYEQRLLPAGTLDNGRLAILADALEEAGYTSEEMLSHLRGPGPHVRGCRLVYLCLRRS
jgi:hypothetical protein